MAVLRLAAVEAKEKGIIRVIRVQEIEGAKIPGVIAGNGREKCVQKVVFLFVQLRVVDAKDLVELGTGAVHFSEVRIVNHDAERKLAEVIPYELDLLDALTKLAHPGLLRVVPQNI